MTNATAAVSPLRRRMIDDMSLRNLSPATQPSYLHAVSKFSRYFGRSPERIAYARTPRKLPTILSADEVIRFLEAVSSLKSRAALPSVLRDVDGIEDERRGTISVFDGPEPSVSVSATQAEEIAAVRAFVESAISDGIVSAEIGFSDAP